MWSRLVVLSLIVCCLGGAEERRRKPQGGSVGNSGGDVEGKLQYLARNLVSWTLDHEKNADTFTDEERKRIQAMIAKGIPFVVVPDPELLEANRYEDYEGHAADVQPSSTSKAGNIIRSRLLDFAGDHCDARVVWDKQKQAHIVQWDEVSYNLKTKDGSQLPPDLVKDVAHEVFRYAYFTHVIDRNDDWRKISNGLHIPPPDEAMPLASREFRYDFVKRGKVMGDMARELIHLFSTDAAPHKLADRMVRGYQEDLVTLDQIVAGKEIIHQTQGQEGIEKTVENMDAVERSMISQRQTVLVQINLGHAPVENPNVGRHDFPARAKYLATLCQRNLDMIQWHKGLRESSTGRMVRQQIDGISGKFDGYWRADWSKDDEAAAKQFDAWQQYLLNHLNNFRRQYPIRN